MDETGDEARMRAIQRLLSSAYFYLRFRLRTKKELQTYLQKKTTQYSYSADIVETVINQLEENNFINDKTFIESYVTSRQFHKQKGIVALKNELMVKGIPSNLIDEYFEEQPLDEEALARQSLSKVWPRFATYDKLKRHKKAIDYLRRRGFGYDVAKRTIEQLERKE